MDYETVLKPELAERYSKFGLWLNRTSFEFLEEAVKNHPDRELFADGTGRISYGELKHKVERCAAFLRSIGIRRGDVVTIQLRLSRRVLLARADRGDCQQGQS
jgi:non-ribosomal peptide synthetase component E (peptide arylation enzyme)